MSDFLRSLLSLSLSGALLTVVTACLNRLLKGRLPRSFLYYLWLLVLLRFVCPFGLEQSLVNQVVSRPAIVLVEENWDQAMEAGLNGQEWGTVVAHGVGNDGGQLGVALLLILLLIWAVGAAAVLGFRLTGYCRVRKRLRVLEVATEPWEQELFVNLNGEKRSAPRLLRSAGTDTPMLVGIVHPQIYLPQTQMTETTLTYALRHELVHWRRRDLVYKWGLTLTACIHWFNPAVWYLVRAVERDCELSCDECTTRGLSLEERRDYGSMLLQVAAHQSRASGALSAPLWSQKNNLMERLQGIMKPTLNSKKAKCLLAAAVVMVATTSVALGSYTGQAAAKPGVAPLEAEETGTAQPVEVESTSERVTTLTAEERLVWPFDADGEIRLSALYGGRIHPVTGQADNHSGIDVVLEQGTPVLAAASGVVVTAEYGSTNGNYVVVNHGDMSTTYCHLEKWTVEEGETVVAGQQIGTVGRTGMVTGYCLHFEVAVNGSRVDPLDYLPHAEVCATNGSDTAQVEY